MVLGEQRTLAPHHIPVSEQFSAVAARALAGQSQARGAALVPRRAKSTQAATLARPPAARRRILCPASAPLPEPCLGLRFPEDANPKWATDPVADDRVATVLVVGHSNTNSPISSEEGGPTIPNLPDDWIDNLFVLQRCTCRRGAAMLVNLLDGAVSP